MLFANCTVVLDGKELCRDASQLKPAQWRNYYGLRPGEPGGPKPQWAKWGPPGSGCSAKTLARASDMSQCRFLTIRVL
jgi:hypothetical protein